MHDPLTFTVMSLRGETSQHGACVCPTVSHCNPVEAEYVERWILWGYNSLNEPSMSKKRGKRTEVEESRAIQGHE